jgi:hypothetical protein
MTINGSPSTSENGSESLEQHVEQILCVVVATEMAAVSRINQMEW